MSAPMNTFLRMASGLALLVPVAAIAAPAAAPVGPDVGAMALREIMAERDDGAAPDADIAGKDV